MRLYILSKAALKFTKKISKKYLTKYLILDRIIKSPVDSTKLKTRRRSLKTEQ